MNIINYLYNVDHCVLCERQIFCSNTCIQHSCKKYNKFKNKKINKLILSYKPNIESLQNILHYLQSKVIDKNNITFDHINKKLCIETFMDKHRYDHIIQIYLIYCPILKNILNSTTPKKINRNNKQKIYDEIIKFGYILQFEKINKLLTQFSYNSSKNIEEFVVKNDKLCKKSIKICQNYVKMFKNTILNDEFDFWINILNEKINKNDTNIIFNYNKQININAIHILDILIDNKFEDFEIKYITKEIFIQNTLFRYDIMLIIKCTNTIFSKCEKMMMLIIECDGKEHEIDNVIFRETKFNDVIKDTYAWIYGISLLRIQKNSPNIKRDIEIFIHNMIYSSQQCISIHNNYLFGHCDMIYAIEYEIDKNNLFNVCPEYKDFMLLKYQASINLYNIKQTIRKLEKTMDKCMKNI